MAVKLFVLVMTLAEKGQGSLTRSSLVVTCTLVTMLAKEASSSLVRSQCVAGREGKRVCTDPTTYCDTFEDSCKSCISLCEDASQFEDCHLHCKDFLQSLITIHNTKERSDIQTLTIMVAVTAAMTSVVLIAVFCLITMKMSKAKRRLKKESGANQPVHGGQGEGGAVPEEQQLCQPSWFKHFEQQWRHNRQHPEHSWPGVKHNASCKPSSWSKRSNNVDTTERRVPGQLWRHQQCQLQRYQQSQPQRQQQSKLQQQQPEAQFPPENSESSLRGLCG